MAAEKPGSGTTASPLWNRQCTAETDGRQVCYVQQYAVTMPTNTVLLNVIIGFFGPEGKARMIMTAPLGVLLMPGLAITVNSGNPIALPFESCQAGGCRTVTDLDQASLDQIRRGDKMTVRFVTSDQQAIDIPVPLQGLDAALNQLRK